MDVLMEHGGARREIAVREPRTSFRAMIVDEAVFDVWYREAMPRVYAYLYSRCGGDVALAEDLTQQAFVEAVRNADRWDGTAELVTWIVAIARHKLVDHFRRLERDARRDTALRERSDVAAVPMTDVDLDIKRALDALPPEQRLALVLRAVDGLSVREVAAELGRSEDATESLIRRARAAFRQAYDGGDR